MSGWWKCPTDPPCPHGGLLHDVEEFRGDGTETCCVEGCECRGPEARGLVAAEDGPGLFEEGS
jgi:hypothetical protein